MEKLYVANYGDNTVSVIDTATNKVITNVILINLSNNRRVYLNGVVVSQDGTKAYVTSGDDGNVSVIDTTTNSVIHTVE